MVDIGLAEFEKNSWLNTNDMFLQSITYYIVHNLQHPTSYFAGNSPNLCLKFLKLLIKVL